MVKLGKKFPRIYPGFNPGMNKTYIITSCKLEHAFNLCFIRWKDPII